ncbi:hypothetical protein [Prevotella sp. P4-67]|uniref:hypothetical protein n=1 Tax=Prevotella sp. P4-67 TaxID=2024227 RepID=UPI0020B155BB|nr:hypothetical protein [Prevotella sp. P4-67]
MGSNHKRQQITEGICFSSVEMMPDAKGSALFITDSSKVFKDDIDISPVSLTDGTQYMPWGGDNLMPYHILDMIEKDETLSTCQMFNAEVCYGSGLVYNTASCAAKVREEVEDFLLANSLPSYFLGVCQDFKHFGWCVSVIILDNEGKRIVALHRKEVCYCRFSPADDKGRIEYVLYANWNKSIASVKEVEKIPLLSLDSPWVDLQERMKKKNTQRKFAVVCRVPTPDSTYYPIPYYAALFRGKWYNIKQLIGLAKEAKLKNSAPLKYHIEVSQRYWEGIFKRERITDLKKQQERVVKEKQQIIDFLTGAENSGKALFSTFYITPNGEEQHDVRISRIDDTKEGGDWSTDIQEAVNMVCFTMRVHSNLVGSVPGKSQSNNSGSDKRELYTIAQALQKPYHDLLFTVHRIIMKFNEWKNAYPECPFIQLTTLDENRDAKQVSADTPPND